METMEHRDHPEKQEPRVNKEKKVHQEKMVLTDSPDLLVSREIRV